MPRRTPSKPTRQPLRCLAGLLFRWAEVAPVTPMGFSITARPLDQRGGATRTGADRMPAMTRDEIDALLDAERGFARSAASLAEINRLLDLRLQCGLEAEAS